MRNVLIFLLSFLVTALAGLLIILPFVALGSLITMWAWNIFVPAIFGLSKITFLQAFAVNILAGLIFRVVKVRS